jgi:hypothetical protein
LVSQPRTTFRIYFRKKPGQYLDDDRNVMLVTGRHELDRILARKTPIAVAWEKAKIYKCTACGHREAWGERWAWHGSGMYGQQEIEIHAVSCSNDCRTKLPKPERQWISYEPLRARERARRQTIGMSEQERSALTRARRTVPLPECPTDGKRRCSWCTEEIVEKRAWQMSWHRHCKRIWLLHYDRNVQTDFLIARDGNDCWDCAQGGHWHRIGLVVAKYTWEAWPLCCPPAWSRERWNDRHPDDLAQRKVEGVIVGLYSSVEYRRQCGELEVDHEIPLWSIWHLPDDERRPYYGPENLRLRCKACHKVKSKRESAERAQQRSKGPIDLDAV